MIAGWKFYSRYEVASDAYTLYMRYEDHNGRRFLVMPVELERIVPGNPYSGLPSLGPKPGEWTDDSAPTDDIRGFLAAALELAWEMGLRPKGHEEHGDELSAVRYHLEDMRKLAKVK